MPMAERGEGSEAQGGSDSNSSSPSPVSRIRNQSTSQKISLPPRKRKFSHAGFDNEDSSQAERLLNSDSSDIFVKRRRTINISNQGETSFSQTASGNNLHSRLLADQHCTSLIESDNKRRSSRGSYPVGFYAEEEQKCLAAFRDRTCELRSRGISLEREFGSANNWANQRVNRHRRISDSLAGGHRSTRSAKKMSDRRTPSFGEATVQPETSSPTNNKETRSNKSKTPRRHTLPGKSSRSEMGVSLSKCLSTGTAQGSEVQQACEQRPSTSGLNIDDRSDNVALSTSVIDQLMRKLPLRKKSNSEQDLQQIDAGTSGLGSSRDQAAQRRHDERRRRSANLEAHNNLSIAANRDRRDVHLDPNECDEMGNGGGPVGGALKLYPLRNRLRASDACNPGPGGNSSLTAYGCPPVATSDGSLYNILGTNESQSLPSSPSSAGGALLETFKRFRDTRRFSHEPQPSGSGNHKRNQQANKDNKQASGPWKRSHAMRKSPMSSKRSLRTPKTTPQSSSSIPSQSSRSKVSTGSGLMGQLLPNSRTSHYSRSGAHMGGGVPSVPMNVPVPPMPIPASSALSALGGTASNSSALASSALGSMGAMANANLASGSSSNPSSSLSLANSLLVGADLESDEGEMGRLEALLASRGLPPSLFGALGPRMQHILHRSVSSSINAKAQQLLLGLQAADESEQLQAVIEMCQLLVMGNEDTLAGFPIKQVTPALIHLLNMEHNFDMMNHACRALTYMMEALPRSSAVVVEAVPAFLEKLQAIQCMDVAEQSLTALNMLSKKHSKAILHAHGVAACLMFIDFFSTNAQRNALGITANCFQSLLVDDFHYASGSLQSLSTRLTTQGDKKCVESVCLAYSRLVDSFHNDPSKLQQIAGHDLLTNIQQLLVMSPSVLPTATFIMVIRMLSVMCASCPELAVELLKKNIAQTLCYLLTNSTDLPLEQVDLVARTPPEFYEITCLMSELMPVLPLDGIFAIDAAILKPLMVDQDVVMWQWQEDRGPWHNYSLSDSRMIEVAHQSEEYEITISIHGVSYTLDFQTMQQINDNTGTTRAIQRKIVSSGISNTNLLTNQVKDARAICLEEGNELTSTLIKSLFALLHEVYSSSAGPTVRYKCLRAMLRMVHFSSSDLLKEVLKSQAVSSHLAAMLSSPDVKIIVGALQMTSLLMEKLPHIFAIYFRREGVMHQIRRLCEPDSIVGSPKSSHSGKSVDVSFDVQRFENASSSRDTKEEDSGSQMRLGDVLRQKKRQSKGTSRGSSWKSRHQDSFSDSVLKSGTKDSWKSGCGGRNKHSGGHSGSGSGRTSFLSSFNLARWGRTSSTSESRSKDKAQTSTVHGNAQASANYANYRETTRNWIREQAQRLNALYFSSDVQGSSHPALTVLNRLMAAVSQLDAQDKMSVEALKEISEIVKESDISPFEVIHSGLVRSLLNYLTWADVSPRNTVAPPVQLINGNSMIMKDVQVCLSEEQKSARDARIMHFLNVFLGCSLDSGACMGAQSQDSSALVALINKLNGCVNQLEQFPVKVHDLPGSAFTTPGRSGSTSAIKFFNTHQLRCNLQRHPDCSQLRQWRGGPVKVDPLALVQAIERYLVIRGYGRVRDPDDDNSDDDNSEEEIDDSLAAVSVSQGTSAHKLQFLIGDHVLPYSMTVYQAIKVYGSQDSSTSEGDTDSDVPISHSSVWLQTHTIYYRSIQEESVKTSSRKGKSNSKHSPKRKDSSLSEASIYGGCGSNMLDSKLTAYLPTTISVKDPSNEVLCLLRVLYSINRYYGSLYPPGPFTPPLPTSDFLNAKLTAKANRQLQDPLVIMTGNLPQWLPQIVYACPFMFPFETRQLLFYAVTFDRDRTLQRLLEASPELSSSDSSERVTPRLERRKRTVNRDDILKQGEAVLNDLASSRAMLEIQYENEVGTGLGPTLEFYALISKELQKADLELWRGDAVTIEESAKDKAAKSSRYVCANNGLFPQPVAKNMKSSHVTKLKNKFKFLGKLMAKAVMDSRMLDVRLHECVYKWLLGEERSLGLADIIALDPALGQTLSKLQNVAMQKKKLQLKAKEENIPGLVIQEKMESLTIDGCKVQDLALNFTLPGYPCIELKKGGSDIELTINNIEQYMQFVVEWFLREGVWRQMEALREGFESVFPISQLQVFYPEELEQLFCGSIENEQWDVKQLAECCRPDHGYNHESKAVKFLLQILSEYGPQQQRSFLQFVTGSPRLPVGGFKSLSPPLTIVRKTFETGEDPDQFLPSVMTCVNYLKLPDYSTLEIMRHKMDLAAKEGQHSFHLS